MQANKQDPMGNNNKTHESNTHSQQQEIETQANKKYPMWDKNNKEQRNETPNNNTQNNGSTSKQKPMKKSSTK